MKFNLGIFANDQLNKAGFCIPASELMKEAERSYATSRARNLPLGRPSYIQHDMHRLIGWSVVLGHVIDGAAVQTIGLFAEAETDNEKAELFERTKKYWEWIEDYDMATFKLELLEKLEESRGENFIFSRVESYAISRPGIAYELYPKYFSPDSDLVDKDGLVDYRTLIEQLQQIQPGVFLDPERKILLFAHKFFRRNLSQKNKLNEYFLSSFKDAIEQTPEIKPRFRLDPDTIGHPATIENIIELEYWHGPKFNNDIYLIQAGPVEYAADDRTRYFEGVHKTHFWWKEPEDRAYNEMADIYRVFEAEELIENTSVGLQEEHYGCRYVHSEYSQQKSCITHFDGAIRSYPAEKYFERIDKSIAHAGKNSEYTKLFRIDGLLPVESWKRLLNDYFRGNPLVSEYLGLPDEVSGVISKSESTVETNSEDDLGRLCACICLDDDLAKMPFTLRPEGTLVYNEIEFKVLETGLGEIDAFLRNKINLTNFAAAAPISGVLHLSWLCFGASPELPGLIKEIVEGVATALLKDVEKQKFQKVAIAISWPINEMNIVLSFRGESVLMAKLLTRLFCVVDPTQNPSNWIEPLSALIKELDPRSKSVNDIYSITNKCLRYERTEETKRRFFIAAEMLDKINKKTWHWWCLMQNHYIPSSNNPPAKPGTFMV